MQGHFCLFQYKIYLLIYQYLAKFIAQLTHQPYGYQQNVDRFLMVL
jgi:hypothetical protein